MRHHALFLRAQCVHDVAEELRERAQHFRLDVRDVVEADPATYMCSDVTAFSVNGPLHVYMVESVYRDKFLNYADVILHK